MDKLKGFLTIVIAVTSIVLIVFIANKLLDTTGKVNQGNFRISDLIIESNAKVVEVQDKELEITNLSSLVFDISQTNKISILIEKNVKASKIYIENIKVTDPELKGKMTISQKDYEKYEITSDLNRIELKIVENNDKYIVDFILNNDNVIMDKSVDDTITEIQYDGKIFESLGIGIESLVFEISFDLCIEDEVGNIVVTNMKLKMPTDELLSSGMSILRQDVSKYIFTII